MKRIASIAEMHRLAAGFRREGKRIGFVPTMGALHEGHLSLMRLAKRKSDVGVMSIFVNPTQFGPAEDFARYPRNMEQDSRLAESAGTDLLFTPSVEEMYPDPYRTYVTVESLTSVLEGKSRPTHFRGVTTIVAKLFNITLPHIAVFGQKDAQQAIVIERMVQDLDIPVEIIVAPIVREPDGLAMSSRNVYLSTEERAESVVLNRSLRHAESMIGGGERSSGAILAEMKRMIASQRLADIDYVAVCEYHSLKETDTLERGATILISLAVRFGKTRLIDNTIVTIP